MKEPGTASVAPMGRWGINQALSDEVNLQFDNASLAEVVQYLNCTYLPIRFDVSVESPESMQVDHYGCHRVPMGRALGSLFQARGLQWEYVASERSLVVRNIETAGQPDGFSREEGRIYELDERRLGRGSRGIEELTLADWAALYPYATVKLDPTVPDPRATLVPYELGVERTLSEDLDAILTSRGLAWTYDAGQRTVVVRSGNPS
ncbi:MAG: hypothetical protein HYV27_21890 [Candidatus Hydrogenedentes bacterium]|nr:hypothetical protein [Candidatus Hydrogenedentota bacterium]